jgi:hypothetical protein
MGWGGKGLFRVGKVAGGCLKKGEVAEGKLRKERLW